MADDFGACCKDLHVAMTEVPETIFYVDRNGVLFMTAGRLQTERGPANFDIAVKYCPFSGRHLQTAEEIRSRGELDDGSWTRASLLP